MGLILQFSVMPVSALLISLALGLERDMMIGMMLAGYWSKEQQKLAKQDVVANK